LLVYKNYEKWRELREVSEWWLMGFSFWTN
jgi:hypothetical protein